MKDFPETVFDDQGPQDTRQLLEKAGIRSDAFENGSAGLVLPNLCVTIGALTCVLEPHDVYDTLCDAWTGKWSRDIERKIVQARSSEVAETLQRQVTFGLGELRGILTSTASPFLVIRAIMTVAFQQLARIVAPSSGFVFQSARVSGIN